MPAETKMLLSKEKSTLVACLGWAAIIVGSLFASCMVVNAQQRAHTEADVTDRLYHKVAEARNTETSLPLLSYHATMVANDASGCLLPVVQ